MNPLIINRNLDAPSGAFALPEDGWHQIEARGEHPNPQAGIVQVIDGAAVDAIVADFAQQAAAEGDAWGGMLIDRDHLSHSAHHDTEAMGWLMEVRNRAGQLEGRIRWTDSGEAAVKGGRWRRFSTEYDPASLERLDGNRARPRRLVGLALTNRPNNRGGRPISNCEGAAAPAPTPPPNPLTMKTIAEKLGLPPESTEDEILGAIGTLQEAAAKLQAAEADSEAEAILNRLADRLPADNAELRTVWKGELIRNREAAAALLEAMPKVVAAAPPPRLHNREAALTPAPVTAGEDAKADQQAALVSQIRNRDRCSHTQAWDQARREKPELFQVN